MKPGQEPSELDLQLLSLTPEELRPDQLKSLDETYFTNIYIKKNDSSHTTYDASYSVYET